MEIKEVLSRIGYVRNCANLSAREVSLRMGMSPQYVAQLESGRIVLTVEKLLQILEICQFPIERFFSSNIDDYNIDIELKSLIESLPINKKKNIIEFMKKWIKTPIFWRGINDRQRIFLHLIGVFYNKVFYRIRLKHFSFIFALFVWGFVFL